jgi:hypothetical protein
VASAAAPAIAQALKRLASRSTPSRAGIPASSAFSGRITPNARPPGCDDACHGPSPQLRRRHVLAAEMPIYQARFVNHVR